MKIHPFILALALFFVAAGVVLDWQSPYFGLTPVGIGIGILLALGVRVANQWERVVVLRLGRFSRLRGPGIFCVIPLIDTIPYCLDLRTIAAPFTAEQTLTGDSVPVDVDAVLFWRVIDSKKAALEVENYRLAIGWAAQTALRDVIGETDLAEMLKGRREIDAKLCKIIDDKTEAWGIEVLSVELRDVKIPTDLQKAMSMQAQAERERQARVILSESEVQVAQRFHKAAESYVNDPTALYLRAMNILLEGMRNNSSVVIVPSRVVETMGLGGAAGLTALAKEFAPGGSA